MEIRIDIQVERWPIGRLILRITNPRTHTPEQVAKIAASVAEFGFNRPILSTRKLASSPATADCSLPGSSSCMNSRFIVIDHLRATSNQPLTEDLREKCRLVVGALHVVCAARSNRRDRGDLKSISPPTPSNVPPCSVCGREIGTFHFDRVIGVTCYEN